MPSLVFRHDLAVEQGLLDRQLGNRIRDGWKRVGPVERLAGEQLDLAVSRRAWMR